MKADLLIERSFLKGDEIIMQTATTRKPLFHEGDIAAVDPKLQRLMQLCGIEELPPVHTMLLPLNRIRVPNEEHVHPSARFVRSIELLGIRQPPSIAFVNGTSWDADDAVYDVVMGRRRIVSARHLLSKGDARFQHVKCEVYERNAPRLNAFLGLVENDQRSESWIQDVVNLRQLIREGIGMTLDDLKAYGFNARTIRGRLAVALLPGAMLDQICSGTVSQDAALQITRLNVKERERLDTLCREGGELTDELVKTMLKRQVNQGLAPVHADLSQAWTALSPAYRPDADASSFSLSPGTGAPLPQPIPDRPASVSSLLSLLRHVEPQTRTSDTLHRARLLIVALIHELQIVERSLESKQKEGGPDHV